MKTTYIDINEITSHKERDDFVPVCMYGDITPEIGEIGSIVKIKKCNKEKYYYGLWVNECEYIERVIVRS